MFEDAIEVTKSELKSGTANNDLNYFSMIYPNLQVGTSVYLHSDFSNASNVDTSYFAVSRNHSLRRWVRVAMDTNLINYTFDDQDRYTYKGRYREIVSWVSWEGVAGSNGTV